MDGLNERIRPTGRINGEAAEQQVATGRDFLEGKPGAWELEQQSGKRVASAVGEGSTAGGSSPRLPMPFTLYAGRRP